MDVFLTKPRWFIVILMMVLLCGAIKGGWQPYGMLNFTLTIHLLPVGITDQTSIFALEQDFIDTLNPAYNILLIAGSSMGNPVSEGTKQQLREERGTSIFIYNFDSTQLLYTF